MSAPHIVPGADVQDRGRPERRTGCCRRRSRPRCADAASQAVAGLTEARMGHESGLCDVNVEPGRAHRRGLVAGLQRDRVLRQDRHGAALRDAGRTSRSPCSSATACGRRSWSGRPGRATRVWSPPTWRGRPALWWSRSTAAPPTALFFMGAAGDQAPALTGAGSSTWARRRRMKEVGDAVMRRRDDRGATGGRGATPVGGDEVPALVPVPLIVRESADGVPRPRDGRYPLDPAHEAATSSPRGRTVRESCEVIRLGDVALVGAAPRAQLPDGSEHQRAVALRRRPWC